MLIWILEDNSDRQKAMQEQLASLGVRARFFRSAVEFIAAIDAREELPELISLDHDLHSTTQSDMGSGTDVADRLARELPTAPILIASTNVPASQTMHRRLNDAGWPVDCIVPHDDLAWIAEWAQWVQAKLAAAPIVTGSSPQSTLFLRLTDRVEAILNADEVGMLGLINFDGEVAIYEFGPVDDPARGVFRGHRQLLQSGVAPGQWEHGFSVVVVGGEVRAFNCNSIANRNEPNFLLPADRAGIILAWMRKPLSSNFRQFHE
jgi:CheY-like chemotaxis protein